MSSMPAAPSVLAVLAAVVLIGCAEDQRPDIAWPSSPALAIVHSVPVGPAAPARPADCSVAFDRISARDAGERLDEAGVICVSVSDSETLDSVYGAGTLHEAARKQACALGADTVIPLGFCPNVTGRGYAIELGAFRSRTKAP